MAKSSDSLVPNHITADLDSTNFEPPKLQASSADTQSPYHALSPSTPSKTPLLNLFSR